MRLAIVVPRYGLDILGGAETFARCLAEEMTARGLRIDVLTTCVRNHYTWRNELPAGCASLNGIRVWRFPVQPDWETPRYHDLHARILLGLGLTMDEQYEWVDRGPHSPALYAFIEHHQAAYDFFVFVPYLFSTTFYGASVAPHKSIIWPCLHDEGYARLTPTLQVLSHAHGLMLNSEPERRLAHRLGIHNPGEAIVGFGISPMVGDAQRFRDVTRLTDPFILYSGRLEGSKNLPLLLRCFITYKKVRGGPLKLVLMGVGPEAIPKHPDIVQLGFQQGWAKLDAYAAATVLCQPSLNESFSIVIMEAWQACVPVLVHAHCAVTLYHVRKSRGGLYFSKEADFVGAVDWLLENPDLRAGMGQNGWRYVTTNYNWDAVADRFEAALQGWQALPSSSDRESFQP